LSRALLTPGVARLTEEGLELLREAGFDEDEAQQAWSALLSYTVGAEALGAGESFDYGLDRLLDGLAAVRARG
jgi:hypothetical protein